MRQKEASPGFSCRGGGRGFVQSLCYWADSEGMLEVVVGVARRSSWEGWCGITNYVGIYK